MKRRNAPRRHAGAVMIGGIVAATCVGEATSLAQNTPHNTPFDDAINMTSEPGTNNPLGAEVMPGLKQNRFRLTYSGTRPQTLENAIYAAEYEIDDAPDGGIILRRMGNVAEVPGFSEAGSYFELDRGDGQLIPVWRNFFEIHVGNALKWEANGNCPAAILAVHPVRYPNSPGRIPHELKIVAGPFDTAAWPHADTNVWRRNINDPRDYCQGIVEDIAAATALGGDPFSAGLLQEQESSLDEDELTAPESENFSLVTRLLAGGEQVSFLRAREWRNETQTEMLDNLSRAEDGSWIGEIGPEDPDPLGEKVWSTVDLITPAGRQVTLFVVRETNADTEEPLLSTFVLEGRYPRQQIREIPITMEISPIEPDDDADGRPNNADGCRGRGNPIAGIDTAGPQGPDTPDGKEDECGANCEGNWSYMPPPIARPANPEDFWDCVESELGFEHAQTRIDGSYIHFNGMLVHNAAGEIEIQPGQRIRFIQSSEPHYVGPELGIPVFRLPPGNSWRFRILSAKHADGRDGMMTVSHNGQPQDFTHTTDWIESGGIGWDDFFLAQSGEFEIEARSENAQQVPDAGVPDAGTAGSLDGGGNAGDGGKPDGGTEVHVDAGGLPLDAGTEISHADAGGLLPDAGAKPTDGGQKDAGELMPVDGGKTDDDAGAPDAGADVFSSDGGDAGETAGGQDASGIDGGSDLPTDAGEADAGAEKEDAGDESAISDDAGFPREDAPDGSTPLVHPRQHAKDHNPNSSDGCGCGVTPDSEPGFIDGTKGLLLGLAFAFRRKIRRNIYSKTDRHDG